MEEDNNGVVVLYKNDIQGNRIEEVKADGEGIRYIYNLKGKPVIGRFTQMDTYLGDGLNLYAYVQNNPVRYVDPSGHCAKCSKENGVSESNLERMLGAKGTQISSKTTWQNGKIERIDVENPAPGERSGQVHYHDSNNNKYYYDIDNNIFYEQKTGELASKSIQKLLKDKDFMKGIKIALQILGE